MSRKQQILEKKREAAASFGLAAMILAVEFVDVEPNVIIAVGLYGVGLWGMIYGLRRN